MGMIATGKWDRLSSQGQQCFNHHCSRRGQNCLDVMGCGPLAILGKVLTSGTSFGQDYDNVTQHLDCLTTALNFEGYLVYL